MDYIYSAYLERAQRAVFKSVLKLEKLIQMTEKNIAQKLSTRRSETHHSERGAYVASIS